MAGRRRRRWHRFAVMISGAALGLSIWLGTSSRDEAPKLRQRTVDAIRHAGVALPQAVAAAPPTGSADSRNPVRNRPDQVQVCGGAWVTIEQDGSFDQAELARAARLPQARAAVLATLAAEPSEVARLAGVFISAFSSDDQRRAVLMNQPMPCEGAECAAVQAADLHVARARETIARAASVSDDPKVYGLAMNVCDRRAEGACQLLTARQWARLDPGNASPWLYILDDARAHHDAATQTEALYRIASAQRNELAGFSLAGAVLKLPPADDKSTLASYVMASAALGVEAAWAMPGYQAVNQLCRGDELRDANRAQLCAGVAAVLADRSDTMIGREIGARLATRLGRPVEDAERMRGEYLAYVASFASVADAPTEFSCTRIRRELDRMRRVGALGEVGAMREWVARSGKKAEDFVLLERERVRDFQAPRAGRDAAASAVGNAGR